MYASCMQPGKAIQQQQKKNFLASFSVPFRWARSSPLGSYQYQGRRPAPVGQEQKQTPAQEPGKRGGTKRGAAGRGGVGREAVRECEPFTAQRVVDMGKGGL